MALGEYSEWDRLNEEYGIEEIDLYLIDSIKVVLIYFSEDLNPKILGRLYKDLPGIEYVEPDSLIGDSYNVYPRQTDSGMTYLFYNGWGDCPSGCINRYYWYVSCINNNCTILGQFLSSSNSNKPYWWDEAKENINLYRSWWEEIGTH